MAAATLATVALLALAAPASSANATTNGLCHTALEGEACYDLVAWAMSDGIYSNPEWYPGLTKDSSFSEFQTALFDTRFVDENRADGRAALTCSLPCPGMESCCCVADNASACHEDIIWAMTDGINGKPEDYEGSGLTPNSSYVEFQTYLSGLGSSTCVDPCSEPYDPNKTKENGGRPADPATELASSGAPLTVVNIGFALASLCLAAFMR